MKHNALCSAVVDRFDGRVIKQLGDGILCEFDNPLDACLAALNIRRATESMMEIKSKVAITCGAVESIELDTGYDILGSTIDRCARILGVAKSRQILIDMSVKSTIDSVIRDYPDIQVSPITTINLRGIGGVQVMEVTTQDMPFVGPIETADTESVASSSPDKYPDEIKPDRWLRCDISNKPINPERHEAVILIENTETSINRVSLTRKGSRERFRTTMWFELEELKNPIKYIQFVATILRELATKQKHLKTSQSIIKIMLGLYQYVFRPPKNAREEAEIRKTLTSMLEEDEDLNQTMSQIHQMRRQQRDMGF